MASPFLLLWLLPALLLPSFPSAVCESPHCLTVYKEGGAPAVLQSPKCPRWSFPAGDRRRPAPNCQLATLQGRRRYQEDRAVCALDMRIPFLGRTGVEEINVGMVAIFDGHNGAEASDMASKLLLEYFLLHTYFLLDDVYSKALTRSNERLTYNEEQDVIFQVPNTDKVDIWHNSNSERSNWMSSVIFDGHFHLEILKESLLRTIRDIDVTFSKEALRKNLDSGSTAVVILIADGHVLVANVGDSKALLCSEVWHSTDKKGNASKSNRHRRRNALTSPISACGSITVVKSDGLAYYVKELTRDHHPDRYDERNRVEAAGGYVSEWADVHRVNGQLAVSRSIGDVSFKSYGVISTPEVTDWRSLSSNDSYLVAASDGIFEKMTTQEVCDLLLYEKLRSDIKSDSTHIVAHSLADCILKTAYERGTMDNMAAVVVPLKSDGISGTFVNTFGDECTSGVPSVGLQKGSHEISDGAVSTNLIPMEYFNQIMAKFDRLLVETKYKKLGCFYLSENLDEKADYVFRAPKNCEKDEVHDSNHTEHLGTDTNGGPLDLHSEEKFCWHFGIHVGDKGQCTSPEVFAHFIGLLDSVPYNDTPFNSSESFGYKLPDFRYILKRRFDRGSYGEVWLAFHWNCCQEDDTCTRLQKDTSRFASSIHVNANESGFNTGVNSSDKYCFTNSSDCNLYILKRIMVERGTTAYLSGLREKYFGEIFLNASMSLGGSTVTTLGRSLTMEAQIESFDPLLKNISEIDEVDHNMDSTVYRNFRTGKVIQEEGIKHIARFVEAFESKSKEIWLVFRNEGLSLSKLIYTAVETKTIPHDERNENLRNIHILQPSAWWHWLKTTDAGKKEMQNIIWQLLTALKSCHDRNITHRDIKPENMIICFEDVESGRCLREIPSREKRYHLKMRIIDFGSAIDEFSLKYLYGSGPTRSEQTFEYTPPEALLNASWFQGPKSVVLKYDLWSVGVVMLELILGSPHVFQISDRTRALLDLHLEGWSEHTKELAYKLRSYMEMCILIPGISPHRHPSGGMKDHVGVSPACWKCSEESFSHQVKSRDPLKLGFPNAWALRLVRQLLMWHPEDRLSVDEALSHPYFQQPP